MLKRFILSLFLAVGVLLPAHSFAAIDEVLLEMDGLYCPFCSAPTERRVRKAMDASSSEQWLKDGIIRFEIAPNTPFRPEAGIKKLEESSYNYVSMTIKATGKLSVASGGTVLEVPENDISFKLEDSDDITLKAKNFMDSATGKTVTIVGKYYPNPQNPKLPILKVEQAS